MAVAMPIRLDLVKIALRTLFVDALDPDVPADQIMWVDQDIPRPARPLVTLNMIAGPTQVGRLRREHRFRPVMDSIDFTLDSVTIGETYRVRVNGVPFEQVAAGADTPASVRNRLLSVVKNNAAIVPATKLSEPITVVGSGTSGILVTPATAGGLISGSASPPSDWTVTETPSTTDCALDVVARERMTVQVDIWTKGNQAIELGSRAIGARLQAAIDTPDGLDTLRNYRVAAEQASEMANNVEPEPGGARHESRSTFDLFLYAGSIVSRTVVPIESVEATISFDGTTLPDDTFTVGP